MASWDSDPVAVSGSWDSDPIPAALQVNSPADQWGRIGAENMSQAGIRPMTTPMQTAYGAMMAAVPFNAGDEFAAAANATGNTIQNGGSFGQNYDSALANTRDAQSRFATEHPIANFALGLPANIASAIALGQPASLAGATAQGAGLGAAAGFGAGQGGAANRVRSAIPGALEGAGTSLALGALGRSLQQPNVRPNVALLQNEGVPLTTGQIVGGIGKKTEDIATSIPVMGDMIAARQSGSLDGLNRAVANRALAPIGQTLPDSVNPGRDTVSFVRSAMKNAYNSALGKMSADLSDPQFATDLQTAAQKAATTLPDDQLNQFTKIIKGQIPWQNAPGGVMDGETVKGVDSVLTNNIKGYGAGNWNDQQLAAALTDVKGAFRGMLARQNRFRRWSGCLFKARTGVSECFADCPEARCCCRNWQCDQCRWRSRKPAHLAAAFAPDGGEITTSRCCKRPARQ
jgi:hypothetical protein